MSCSARWWPRSARPGPAGTARRGEALLAEEARIRDWIERDELQLTNVHGKLAHRGIAVPYRTLHRFAVARCGFGRRRPTVRVADGEPGVECKLEFGRPRTGATSGTAPRSR